jgi:mannose-6-phosphate isomerase-like protein (cupin superfamily)
MTSPIIAPPLAGQVLGSVSDAFVIAEWKDPGGRTDPPRFIAPPHLHHSDDEAWYVLEGILRVRVRVYSCRAARRIRIGTAVQSRSAICSS